MSASLLFPHLPPDWTESISQTDDGVSSFRIWKRAKPRSSRALFIVHGFGEQSNRYQHFAHYLSSTVDMIVAVDLIGHGLSSGKRGHCQSIEQIRKAVFSTFLEVEAQESTLSGPTEWHWFGHSFGGLVSISLADLMPAAAIKSLTICAPLLALSMPVPPLKKFFGELIAPILPSLSLENEINESALSRDASVGKMYVEDPLNHQFVTPRMFKEMNLAMASVQTHLPEFHLPTLVMIPLDDKIVDAQATYRWVKKVREQFPASPLNLSTWPQCQHELFNDLDKARAFVALDSWLQSFK